MRIGRYEVLGEIARGGFGVVLRARDQALGRDVAVKILLGAGRLTDLQRKRFEREVNALARLRHPNIVSVHEAGTSAQGPYVVMDLIDGESLDDRLVRDGPLPIREALRLMEVVTRAIAYAHEQRLLHRDLKPGNILVDRLGTPFVTDFGLAKDVDPRLTAEALSRTGAALGTPGFWPPEQAYGQLERMGTHSDVYSLGATLYALLTGQAPYEADSVIEVLGLMSSPPAPPSHLRPGLPAAVDAVVLRAMAPDPAQRFGSAEELGAALTEARRRVAASTADLPDLGAAMGAQPAGRRRAVAIGGGVALVGLVAFAAVVAASGLGPAPGQVDPGAVATTSSARTEPPPPTTAIEPAPGPATTETPPRDLAAEEEQRVREAVAASRTALLETRIDDAIRLIEEALTLRPDDVDARLQRARIALVVREAASCIADAEAVLDREPDHVPALLLRAAARKELGDPSGVAADATHALERDPDQPDAYALRGWARNKLGDVDAALDDWTRAIELQPRAEWLVEVGNIEYQKDRLDDALADFSRALALDPREVLALLNRAAVHTRQGHPDLARQDLDQALALRPDLSIAWWRRAEARRALHDLEGALTDLDEAIRLDPSPMEPWRLRGSVKSERGDAAGAIADYEQALRRDPQAAPVWTSLAALRHRSGDTPGGKRDIEEALRLDPRHVMAWRIRGEIKSDTGDYEGAVADYTRALELDPDDSDAYFNRGVAWAAQGDTARARADYDAALEREPDFAECWLTRGDLRRRTDDLDGALADTTRALELAPDHPKAKLAAALARHFKGEKAPRSVDLLKQAEALYGEYLATDPADGRILAERGRCREALSDREGAIADYRRALEVTPVDKNNIHGFVRGRLKALGVQ